MKRGRKKVAATLTITAILTAGMIATAAPAYALCGPIGGTNPITIQVGPLEDPIIIRGTSPVATYCVDASVEGDPNPQVDPDVTVEPGTGCGIPCFVVAWDGVSTSTVTVHVSVTVNGETTTFDRTFPGEGYGSICVNAGMPCPE